MKEKIFRFYFIENGLEVVSHQYVSTPEKAFMEAALIAKSLVGRSLKDDNVVVNTMGVEVFEYDADGVLGFYEYYNEETGESFSDGFQSDRYVYEFTASLHGNGVARVEYSDGLTAFTEGAIWLESFLRDLPEDDILDVDFNVTFCPLDEDGDSPNPVFVEYREYLLGGLSFKEWYCTL